MFSSLSLLNDLKVHFVPKILDGTVKKSKEDIPCHSDGSRNPGKTSSSGPRLSPG
jgi:hypothetical protein